jgi:hypothetical protein
MPPSSKTTPWRKIEYDNNTSQMAEALVNRSGAALMATDEKTAAIILQP